MILGAVLDDGQAQAGASDLLGMALVHPVEPFKHPALICFRDADAGVRHLQDHIVRIGGNIHCDAAAGPVVLDGVVAEVVYHFAQKLPDPPDPLMISGKLQGYVLLLRNGPQAVQDLLRQGVQIHVLPLRRTAALIQLGELHDIIHQGDHPLALLVDISGKLLHLIRRHHTLSHQLGKAGDRGQRGLELMGHVGGKFPAELLPLLHLLLDGQLLLQDPADQGGQLWIGVRIRIIQVHRIDRAHDLPGCPEGEHAGKHQHQHKDP